ncbi:alpha/beta hydrolase family protein [Pseudomonas piscis]|uniref:Alpha/beta fold hydrolase n=1 Tax=Pseudomonas piscis TaxID=2614538 RepID=A0A7X1U4I4_9PSED|nr:alpha/beta hydrolase [Pseudomonas piscis]MQA54209.1 alpha/beta fold hydrolase [Pseudomonas piscis]
MSREVEIQCADGVVLPGDYHDAQGPAQGVILVSGALGVRRGFYRAFADLAAQGGFDVLLYSYRGAQDELPTNVRCSLADWGVQDISAAIEFCRVERPALPLYFIGHSIGAQLLGLSPAAGQLRAAAFICGSFPYWKRWTGLERLRMGLLFGLLIPLVTRIGATFPARLLGLGNQNLPSRLMQEWSRWVREPDYLLAERFGLARRGGYEILAIPLVSWVFDDDNYVPWAAAQRMHDAYPAAALQVKRTPRSAGAVGHFGFFRSAALQGELLQQLRSFSG